MNKWRWSLTCTAHCQVHTPLRVGLMHYSLCSKCIVHCQVHALLTVWCMHCSLSGACTTHCLVHALLTVRCMHCSLSGASTAHCQVHVLLTVRRMHCSLSNACASYFKAYASLTDWKSISFYVCQHLKCFIYFYFMYLAFCFMHVSDAWHLRKPKESFRSSGTGVTMSYCVGAGIWAQSSARAENALKHKPFL